MRIAIPVLALAVISAATILTPDSASALQDNPAHTHIGHVATAFGGAPDGAGLMPTLRSEIETAIQHLGLAARDPSNLEWVQTHAAHALHATDPSAIDEGPGLGFGIIPAAEGVARHIELAAGSEGASDNVTRHAAHVAAAARAIAERAVELVERAERVAGAGDYTTAQTQLEQMGYLGGYLLAGQDVNGDGQVGWGEGEGGLEQVEQHMGFITEGEGLE